MVFNLCLLSPTMASKLIFLSAYEAQNQFELSLREAFYLQEPKLKPPLKLAIPGPPEYLKLNSAITYGVLCEPDQARTYIKYLHAIVTDGYALFVKLLVEIVDELYSKLVETARVQLIWVASVVVDVAGIGFQNLLVSLLRQIVGGDFSDRNLWLSSELVNFFLTKWDSLLDEHPDVLTSALYVYLGLLADHYRLPNRTKFRELKQKEIQFCLKTLNEQFGLCMKLGRDLVRLLQGLVHIPEFNAFWKTLVLQPGLLKIPEFSDITDLYRSRTSSRYFLLRVTPEMETQLRFLLTNVKFGSQRRHQAWFANKFLCAPERETLICDIVRFICCSHHPSNEVIQSDIVPRWAVIGWLLTCCTKKYVEANVKLALFYDWLFFDEKVDIVMNIEPAMLLMVNSTQRYMDMTQNLLEFLLLLVDNFDIDRKSFIFKGVSSAFRILVQKGVVQTLDVLTHCKALYPFKERLNMFTMRTSSPVPSDHMPSSPLPLAVDDQLPISGIVSGDLKSSQIPSGVDHVSPSTLPAKAAVKNQSPFSDNVSTVTEEFEASTPMSVDLATRSGHLVVENGSEVEVIENLVLKLGENLKKSKDSGLESLELILFLYANLDFQGKMGGLSPDVLASKISNELEIVKYRLFSPLEFLPDTFEADDEIQSPTATIIRAFVYSQNQNIEGMLQSLSKNAHPVGARLLSYALRLAYEAEMAVNGITRDFPSGYAAGDQVCYQITPLLKLHVDAYFAFKGSGMDNEVRSASTDCKVDRDLVLELVSCAFSSYRSILMHLKDVPSMETHFSFARFISSDLVCCSEWERKRLHILFQSIFLFLPDMSVCEEDIIRLLVSKVENSELIGIQFDIGLRRFSIFGHDFQNLSQLVRRSINWDYIEQHRLWSLIRSELSVSKFPVEKLILDVFCSADLDPKHSSLLIGGLLTLCSCCAPTPELVGAILLLPDDKFPDFAAAVLADWLASSSHALFSSLTEFLDKFGTKNGDVPLDLSVINFNKRAVKYLASYVESHGAEGTSLLNANSLQILSTIRAGFSDIKLHQMVS